MVIIDLNKVSRFESFSLMIDYKTRTSSFFFKRDCWADTLFLNCWRCLTLRPSSFALLSFSVSSSILTYDSLKYVSSSTICLPRLFFSFLLLDILLFAFYTLFLRLGMYSSSSSSFFLGDLDFFLNSILCLGETKLSFYSSTIYTGLELSALESSYISIFGVAFASAF